jgi:predicted component of type VI protein secretion system
MIAVYLRTTEMTFGRNSDCDLIYQGNAQGISENKHFTVYNCTEYVYLVDYSTHGTFVNGIQVSIAPNGKKQVQLKKADRIHVGTTRDLRKKTN